MEAVILREIPVKLNIPNLMKRLHLKEDTAYAEEFARFAEKAKSVARPKAMYRPIYVDDKGPDSVTLAGVTLKSRVLRVNMDRAQRAFLYTATCGAELEEMAEASEDLLEVYWSEAIREDALGAALRHMHAHIREAYHPGKIATMAPGSLADWPLTQQRALFNLLGDTKGAVGVELKDSMLMWPTKSVSGIVFPTEVGFENCMLCPRADCPNRRAPYDEALFEERYGMAGPES
jgi:hypothetical protein